MSWAGMRCRKRSLLVRENFIRELYAISGKTEILSQLGAFASPWSPPTWMKTKKVYNYGRIRMEEGAGRLCKVFCEICRGL